MKVHMYGIHVSYQHFYNVYIPFITVCNLYFLITFLNHKILISFYHTNSPIIFDISYIQILQFRKTQNSKETSSHNRQFNLHRGVYRHAQSTNHRSVLCSTHLGFLQETPHSHTASNQGWFESTRIDSNCNLHENTPNLAWSQDHLNVGLKWVG